MFNLIPQVSWSSYQSVILHIQHLISQLYLTYLHLIMTIPERSEDFLYGCQAKGNFLERSALSLHIAASFGEFTITFSLISINPLEGCNTFREKTFDYFFLWKLQLMFNLIRLGDMCTSVCFHEAIVYRIAFCSFDAKSRERKSLIFLRLYLLFLLLSVMNTSTHFRPLSLGIPTFHGHFCSLKGKEVRLQLWKAWEVQGCGQNSDVSSLWGISCLLGQIYLLSIS